MLERCPIGNRYKRVTWSQRSLNLSFFLARGRSIFQHSNTDCLSCIQTRIHLRSALGVTPRTTHSFFFLRVSQPNMSSRVVSIFKSRKTLLEQLSNVGYKTEEYATFTVNEIDAMLASSQLDMLLENEQGRKVYVKYPRSAASRYIQQKLLDELVEDLFFMEDVLTREDVLVILIEDEPNDSLLAKLRTMWDRDGIFIVVHNMQRLQFNVLNHALVPHMRVLNPGETEVVMQKYNIKDKKQIPEISRFDPQAMVLMLRPGQVAEIDRSSPTALSALYYRVCV